MTDKLPTALRACAEAPAPELQNIVRELKEQCSVGCLYCTVTVESDGVEQHEADCLVARLSRIADHLPTTQRAEAPATDTEELRAASAALDEVVAPDPSKSLAQRIRDEFTDFKMLLDYLTTVYVHFSRDRISKPTTLPSEVIRVAEDFASADIEEAIKEARDEWRAEALAPSPDATLEVQETTNDQSRSETQADRDPLQSSAATAGVVSAPAPNDCTPREEALSNLVWWMLGERDELPPMPEPVPGAPRRNYWWRRELRARFEAIYEKYPSTGKVSR